MSEIFLEQWKPSLQYTGQEDVTGQKPGNTRSTSLSFITLVSCFPEINVQASQNPQRT